MAKKRILIIKDGKCFDSHKKESGTNRHHRKAKKNGGTTNGKNISKVCIRQHQAFHYFFNHPNGVPMHPESIAKRLQVLYPMLSIFFANLDGTLKSLEEVVEELNKTWIDPSYEIVVSEPEKVLVPNNNKED